jgi:carboxyl-terminal processing protease
MLEQEEQDRFDSYFTAITEAFDPHTNYMPPTQKEDFDISMRGSLEGIGATLREEDGYIKVSQIIPGSAAWRQGELQSEDVILKVAEGKAEAVDITDMRLRDAVSLIRGKKGTEVRLTARKPDGSKIVIPIIRDVVQIDETFARSTTIKDEKSGKTYGYIRIPSFYRDFQESGSGGRNVTDDVRAEIAKLKSSNIDGLILDVRNNGGGALSDAVSIAGLFISDGPIVQVRSSNGKTQVLNDDDSQIVYSGPLAVLVNEFSASASEILAGALQDYRRAIVIGSGHTHGKGTVQAMLDLDRDFNLRNMEQFLPLGALKVTIQKFYRISGGSTQYRGVVPDIILPDRLQYLKSGEQYLDNSLPWDTIEATDYRPWSQPFPELSWLQNRSQQRIKSDPAWQTINKDAARAKERSEKTLVPLQFSELRRDWLEENKLAEAQRAESGMPKHGEKGKKREPLLSEVDKIKQLGKDTEKDPVAKEAMAILTDITTHPTAVTRKAIKLIN